MSSPNTNNARLRGRWIKILLDTLRPTLSFRARLLVFGIVVLLMGANSAFAQVQTCAIINGGDAGGGG